MIRGERPLALPRMPLAIAAMSVVLALPGPAAAEPVARSVVLPAELAGASDVLPVSRRKTFFVPRRSTDHVLVFAPYSVDDYRGGWTRSRSHSSRSGDTVSQSAEGTRSFSFALGGGSAQLQADCNERAEAAATHERGEPAPVLVPDHSLRCTLYTAGGPFELSVANGRGELVGTGGERFAVSAIFGVASRWEATEATGLLLRTEAGDPVAAVDFAGKGRVVLARSLQPPGREVLAAAAAALLLADLADW